MKKTLLTAALVVSAAAFVHAQGVLGPDGSTTVNSGTYGSFTIDNTANNNNSPTASSGGLVFVNGSLLNQDINIAVYTGNTLIVSLLEEPNDAGPGNGDGTAYGGGQFIDNSTTVYYDTAAAGGATAALTLDFWTGNFATYALADAIGSGSDVASVTFNQALGNLPGNPAPSSPTDFTSMPAVNLVAPVPEPATLAVAGLGGLSMLLIRRRK